VPSDCCSLPIVSEKYSAIGKISIVHYYDPGEIMVHKIFEATDVVISIFITAVILVATMICFWKRDIAIS
jgi:hypothetical protein